MLQKATLTELSPAARPQPVGSAVEVQFNPASLRLQLQNSIDVGRTRGRQVQQYNGTSSTTLSCDLVFDTADEGSTESPVNVRDKTARVRKYLLPKQGSKQAPPRVRFQWGDLIFEGVMSSLTEELDLFSDGGVPLRAKCSMQIKEQDPRFAANESGPGNATGSGAQPAGGGGGGGTEPGSEGGGGERTAPAIGGESAADFAARNGLDPAAWRGIAAGLDSPLSLPAGRDIDFTPGLSSGPGLGTTSGVEAARPASPEAAVGLEPPAPGPSAARSAGYSLAKAGGVSAAVEAVQKAKADAAADAARAAFPAAAPATAAPISAAPAAGTPAQQRSAPSGSVVPSRRAAAAAAPAPAVPRADPRSLSFGFGVPLRKRVGGAVEERTALVQGHARVAARAPAGGAPTTRRPTVPGWVALPASPSTATANGHDCGCGCGGGRGGHA